MNTLTARPLTTINNWDALRVKMVIRRYSAPTIRAYLSQVRIFAQSIRPMEPGDVPLGEIRKYLDNLVARNLCRSTVDQAANALAFFYREVFGMNLDFKILRRPKKKKPAPVILSREEVEQIAVSVENLKHRLMLELCFTAGLWVSELVAVRVDQVNLGRQMIFIPGNGRDHKSRTTVFGFDLMDALKRQIGNKKPDQYLFPSAKGGKLTTRMVSKFFKKALCASCIKKPATPQSLRHSFTTLMVKQGNDPLAIQNLLGQKSPLGAGGEIANTSRENDDREALC